MNDSTGLPKYAHAANDNGRAASPRDAARDIRALVRSGHVEVGSALPFTPRVQTSGRGDPQPPRWSAEGERAQRILGRGYAQGGAARRYALALWLLHGYADSTDALALGLGVLHETEHARHLVVREWTRWGVGGSADELVAGAVALLGQAVGWYETASEEPGCAGHFGELLTHAGGVRGEGGVVGRLREWHAQWLAARVDCHATNRKTRCDGHREPRPEAQPQGACCEQPFPWSDLSRTRGARCGTHDDDCALEWPSVCVDPAPTGRPSKRRAA